MINKNKIEKSFTLIEILVVIAIIGILSMIVFFSVRSAEKKSKDANIKSLMHQIITIAEEFYLNNLNYDSVCDNDNTLSNSDKFGSLEENIKKHNNNQDIVCFENEEKTGYAVSSPLVAKPNSYWCISSLAEKRELDHQITTSTCQ